MVHPQDDVTLYRATVGAIRLLPQPRRAVCKALGISHGKLYQWCYAADGKESPCSPPTRDQQQHLATMLDGLIAEAKAAKKVLLSVKAES